MGKWFARNWMAFLLAVTFFGTALAWLWMGIRHG